MQNALPNPPPATPLVPHTATLSTGRSRGAQRASLGWAGRPFGDEVARALQARVHRGKRNWRAGLAAEASVERHYASEGAAALARRWRCAEGEIDLVIREPDMLVFVEVKRRSRRIEDDPVGERQWRRLEMAAQRYMMCAETGEAPMRFDLAVVGADGSIEVTKNARC